MFRSQGHSNNQSNIITQLSPPNNNQEHSTPGTNTTTDMAKSTINNDLAAEAEAQQDPAAETAPAEAAPAGDPDVAEETAPAEVGQARNQDAAEVTASAEWAEDTASAEGALARDQDTAAHAEVAHDCDQDAADVEDTASAEESSNHEEDIYYYLDISPYTSETDFDPEIHPYDSSAPTWWITSKHCTSPNGMQMLVEGC